MMGSVDSNYVHGYSQRERDRLVDQATTLTDLLHSDTHYPAGARVLEAGCGVGAQTVPLAANSPQASITSIDLSDVSLKMAHRSVVDAGFTNVSFQTADIFDLPFADESFDHIFVCFVLEHLVDPLLALELLRAKLRPGGTITVIEGDHGSVYFYPHSEPARQAIQCLIDLQADSGGDSLIGRQLFPLLTGSGYSDVTVSPRLVYVDDSRPALAEGFTLNTFTAMVEGVRGQACARGMIDEVTFQAGVDDLRRTASSGGVFCYTFFKAEGTVANELESF
jgi:ubiquinone/menaquinone biosynthesis C-methylase UbiE